FCEPHPYTGAKPGGWGWTHLPGSVPDADDTAGVMLARRSLIPDYQGDEYCYSGLVWLLRLQNRDGGWPTFCRGWGLLPFDRSGADLTAHALRAFTSWSFVVTEVATDFKARGGWVYSAWKLPRALARAVAFLEGPSVPRFLDPLAVQHAKNRGLD